MKAKEAKDITDKNFPNLPYYKLKTIFKLIKINAKCGNNCCLIKYVLSNKDINTFESLGYCVIEHNKNSTSVITEISW